MWPFGVTMLLSWSSGYFKGQSFQQMCSLRLHSPLTVLQNWRKQLDRIPQSSLFQLHFSIWWITLKKEKKFYCIQYRSYNKRLCRLDYSCYGNRWGIGKAHCIERSCFTGLNLLDRHCLSGSFCYQSWGTGAEKLEG